MERIHLVIKGRVQGVYYRKSATDQALQLGITGWVRNRRDGSVELVGEGPRAQLQLFMDWCWSGPQFARVTNIDAQWLLATGAMVGFEVRATS